MSETLLVLGLGSNIEAMNHLKKALQMIKSLEGCRVLNVARIYESDPELPAEVNSSPSFNWNQKYLNSAVLLSVNNFQPFHFLKSIQRIESQMGRKKSSEVPRWAPREIDLDILFAKGVRLQNDDLTIPHQSLLRRPFAVLPLLDLLPENELDLELPLWSQQRWILEKPFNTCISRNYFWTDFFGIMNITEDSFSDGNSNLSENQFKLNASRLMKAGAQILDLGAESTRPIADGENRNVNLEKEFSRLNSALTWLEEIRVDFPEIQVSIDCRHPEVVQKILRKFKVNFINDVTGFRNSFMRTIAAESQCQIIAMHSLSVPVIKDETIDPMASPVDILNQWWAEKFDQLIHSGIAKDRIIFDPGIGFGKTPQQNVYLLENLHQLDSKGCSILIGHSRKSFLQLFTNKPASERDSETALFTAKLNKAYYSFLRVHDVDSNKSALMLEP